MITRYALSKMVPNDFFRSYTLKIIILVIIFSPANTSNIGRKLLVDYSDHKLRETVDLLTVDNVSSNTKVNTMKTTETTEPIIITSVSNATDNLEISSETTIGRKELAKDMKEFDIKKSTKIDYTTTEYRYVFERNKDTTISNIPKTTADNVGDNMSERSFVPKSQISYFQTDIKSITPVTLTETKETLYSSVNEQNVATIYPFNNDFKYSIVDNIRKQTPNSELDFNQYSVATPSLKKYTNMDRMFSPDKTTSTEENDIIEKTVLNNDHHSIKVDLENKSDKPENKDIKHEFLIILGSQKQETTVDSLKTNPQNYDTYTHSPAPNIYNMSILNKLYDTPEDVHNYSLVKGNEADILYDSIHENEDYEQKNLSKTESYSQLTDNKHREQLLKEEMMAINKNNKYKNRSVPGEDNSKANELSVRPINRLHTVKSNYKPMKKLDMKPAKQFVRDPDDNSWRNESLSNLGIVFNANNASKSFTQVLKNKTESISNNSLNNNSLNVKPELKQRLEKIAETRKKQKINGTTLYNYNVLNTSKEKVESSKPVLSTATNLNGTTLVISTIMTQPPFTSVTEAKEEDTNKFKLFDEEINSRNNTKFTQIPDYIDNNDDDNAEEVTLSSIDLKKFNDRTQNDVTNDVNRYTTNIPLPTKQLLFDRKPTVQYFPPRKHQKVNINEYDNNFLKKLNYYNLDKSTSTIAPLYETSLNSLHEKLIEEKLDQHLQTHKIPEKYSSFQTPQLIIKQENNFRIMTQDGEIPHGTQEYINFFKEVAKDESEYERTIEYIPSFTPSPFTKNHIAKESQIKLDNYDYEMQLGKDAIDRFVDNFKENNERNKVEFPILYNNTVVHEETGEPSKVVATSNTFLKFFNEPVRNNKNNQQRNNLPFDPNCGKLIELSPAYELHYYLPGQEEQIEVVNSRTYTG